MSGSLDTACRPTLAHGLAHAPAHDPTHAVAPRERRINLVRGEQHMSDGPEVVLTTILGSCVAACVRDPVLGLGGMNHFLLPGGPRGGAGDPDARRYGVHAMELLVNALLRGGAQRNRLEAKLFGGARMMKGLTDIGELNAAFAEQFLRDEGIAMVGGSLRGQLGRRVQFWPCSGRARQMMLHGEQEAVFQAERRIPPPPTGGSSGSVELF